MKRAGLLWFFVITSLFTVSSHAGEFDDEFDNASKANFQPVKSIVGVTLGTPGFLHLNCAMFTESKFGARFAVGGFPGANGTVYGFQASAVKKIGERRTTLHELSLGIGYSMIDYNTYYEADKKWSYVHFSYGLTLKRFMLDVGLSAGSGSYTNPQLVAQLGIALSKKRFHRNDLND